MVQFVFFLVVVCVLSYVGYLCLLLRTLADQFLCKALTIEDLLIENDTWYSAEALTDFDRGLHSHTSQFKFAQLLLLVKSLVVQ